MVDRGEPKASRLEWHGGGTVAEDDRLVPGIGLGRWVRPVHDDTGLVGKLPKAARQGYLGRRDGRRMTVAMSRVRLRTARRDRSATPARLCSRRMIGTPHR